MHQKAPKSFQTPLHMMSKFGELNLLQHLIQLSESNHLRQFMDQSLFQGDFSQHLQYFEDFWGQKRAEINVMDDQDLTPLQVAAQKGHLDVVKCLIENGADVHLWNNDFTLDGKHWTTPLHFAAQEGYHEVVKYLLNFFHVDTWDKDRLTPLHWATRNGHYEVVRCLIDHQARVDAKHFYTLMTPVHFAAANGHNDIVGYLIKNGMQAITKQEEDISAENNASQKRRELRRETIRLNSRQRYIFG